MSDRSFTLSVNELLQKTEHYDKVSETLCRMAGFVGPAVPIFPVTETRTYAACGPFRLLRCHQS